MEQIRAAGIPYHLGHALLDRADHLARSGRADEAELLPEPVNARLRNKIKG